VRAARQLHYGTAEIVPARRWHAHAAMGLPTAGQRRVRQRGSVTVTREDTASQRGRPSKLGVQQAAAKAGPQSDGHSHRASQAQQHARGDRAQSPKGQTPKQHGF
jgi:hypothetical protein